MKLERVEGVGGTGAGCASQIHCLCKTYMLSIKVGVPMQVPGANDASDTVYDNQQVR